MTDLLRERLDFITRRLDELQYGLVSDDVRTLILVVREMVRREGEWPFALIHGPSEITEGVSPEQEANLTFDQLAFAVEWNAGILMLQEYRKHFGDESPTSPFVRAFLERYRDHPEFKEEWLA